MRKFIIVFMFAGCLVSCSTPQHDLLIAIINIIDFTSWVYPDIM